MTVLSGQIAQFIIPSDSIGNPQTTVIDWPNQRLYLLNNNGQRSYSTVFATQSPILSASPAPGGPGLIAAGCDQHSDIIWQASAGPNSVPVYKIDHTTMLPVASYGGTGSGIGNYPAEIDTSLAIVCVTTGGVSYALCKSLISASVYVLRTDTLTPAGGALPLSTGTAGASFICAGVSTAAFATAYLLDRTNSSPAAAPGIYGLKILAAASAYNISSWPTANPSITGGLITNLAASSVDATWTSLITNSIGYDPISGLILVDVSNGNFNSARYLVALNVTTGAVVWKVAVPTGGNYPMDLTKSRIQARSLPYLQASSAASIYGIQTSNGNTTLNTVNGVSAGLSGFPTSSDDVSRLMIVSASPYTQAAGTPTPVSGTPSSFSGLALLNVWPPFPIGITTATVADLWFGPTAGFVDITAQANRRKFVSPVGAAQNLAADGSAPFQVSPPVFLSSNGIPATFANNNGRGGTFVGGAGLTAGASNPPAASETTTSVAVTSPGRGVLGDYLTGNLYAFNPATLTDNGTQRRWLRRWRALPQASFAAVKFLALSIDMQTGTAVPNIGNPQLVLRWSDDGGRTWSDMRIVALGKLGQTAQSIKFNRLGATRRFAGSDRIFELSSSDPFSVAIIDAQVDAQ